MLSNHGQALSMAEDICKLKEAASHKRAGLKPKRKRLPKSIKTNEHSVTSCGSNESFTLESDSRHISNQLDAHVLSHLESPLARTRKIYKKSTASNDRFDARSGAISQAASTTESSHGKEPRILAQGEDLHSTGFDGASTSTATATTSSSTADYCADTLLVSQSWQALYTRDGIEQELGQYILLKMIYLDPAYAKPLQLLAESEDEDEHLSQVCTIFVEVVDMIVTVFWGHLDEFHTEIQQVGKKLRDHGLNTELLPEALLYAFDHALPPHQFPEIVKRAWEHVLNTCVSQMGAE
mmetsp:Transcript_12663/g.16643  ORF Transcript_12663/g.16643 Transcript_12663/m.16643 type:complete len:295 (-) Transcript_12663:63-947(-)